MAVLVVGADSLIGGALLRSLHDSGHQAFGTTRRRHAVNDRVSFLDLSAELENWRPPTKISTCYLLGGQTKLSACLNDFDATRRVNVDGIYRVARILADQGAHVIFTSSATVFDGERPLARITDPVCPTTAYGKQKAEAEQLLREAIPGITILRITKVIGKRTELFESWLNGLRMGGPIRPLLDFYMAPVPLNFLLSTLRLVAQSRCTGILHVSASENVSYVEAARYCAKLIGVDQSLVEPTAPASVGLAQEPRPANATLDIERLRLEFGIEPPSVWWTLEKGFLDPEALGALP